jgi:Flp pilus assembly protein TadG
MNRLRSQTGQATVEFSGMIVWLLLAALCAWQLGLVGWSYASAENAARTAARMYSRVGDTTVAESDGKQSLSGILQSGSKVWFEGDVARVQIKIPAVLPGLSSGLSMYGRAELPHTG